MLSRFAVPLALALCGAGCSQPLNLRFDLGSIPRSQRLDGVRIAVDVDDARPELESLGRHRDGIARIPQHSWSAEVPPQVAVRHAFEHASIAQGARVVDDPDHADFRVHVRILSLDVTTDGTMAGEDTAAAVAMQVAVSDDRGRVVFEDRFRQELEDPQHADPQVLSDAILAVVNRATRRIPTPSRAVARLNR